MSPSGVLPFPNRPLRLPPAEVHDVTTSDGASVRLTHYPGGSKGPVVLAPGYGTSTLAWSIDTVATNFPEYLAEHDYDIWMLDYRASPALEAAAHDYTIDDVAQRDWPAAVAKVLEATGADSVQVVPHCVGSLSFLMASAHGMEGVRSAVCSQLGLHPIPAPMNKVRAKARMAAMAHGVGLAGLSTTFHEEALEDRMLERVMKHVPNREQCDSPVCHRILFIYGEVYDHDRLNDATHDALVHIFGKTRTTAFEHLQLMIREGHALDASGTEAYLPHLDRLAFPITFMHGEHNRMFVPESTERTYEALREANGDDLYDRKMTAGYAHMDCWVGEDAAKDVFPVALAELDRFN